MRRRKDRIDGNQHEIVEKLRRIPGVTVEVGHDDALVGYKGRTFWYEIKNTDKLKKDGTFRKGAIKPDQIRIMENFTGHYRVVTSFEEIMEDINKVDTCKTM